MSAYERETLAVDRAANRIAESANAISEAQRDYALWQLVLSFIGVAFTGVAAYFAYRATHWAKEAAVQTKRSADADNAALTATREAAEEARKEGAEQAKRLTEQLRLSDQTMQFTAKSAYAMSDTASETRRLASAMQTSAEAAKSSAEASIRLVDSAAAADRAYVFFLDTEKVKGSSYPVYLVIWQNFGNTPAMITGVRLGLHVGDDPAHPSTMPRYEMPLGAVIAAGKPWQRGQVSAKNIMDAQQTAGDGYVSAWLCGEVSYRDIHGVERRSWFSRRWAGRQFILDADVDEDRNGYT